MVAETQQQQQSQLQVCPEEEALKRNTDCVYFLASPLTCKKGSECEYRHSEYARVNPRDCYFWLHGNCLNPKCGFRHPPLDGLLGTAASTGSTFSLMHSAAAPATHTSHNSGKQMVPCIFFQKGLCLKSDRCAFMHGSNTTTNKSPQQPAVAHTTEPPSSNKAFGVLKGGTHELKFPLENVSKAVAVFAECNKPAPKTEIFLPRITTGIERNAPPPLVSDVEFTRYKAKNIAPVINDNSLSHSSLRQAHAPDDQVFQHGKDTEEFLRESSPGFDVLVDDELRGSNYYHDEEQYSRTRGHEGRNLNSVNECEMGHSMGYNSMADIDRETFHDARCYDIDRIQGQYVWEQHRGSSDRGLVASSHQERRTFSKAESPGQIDESDLRYRLSKHRRFDGLRSVVSLDYSPDNQVKERSHQNSSRRDSHYLSTYESSLRSRLRGRIKLPRRSPVSGNDLHLEREMNKGRNRGPVSPGKPQAARQGWLRDRIKGRVEVDYNNIGRNLRGPCMRREIMDDISADFAGPKSLAELKTGKNSEIKEQKFLGKRKNLENHQQYDGELSFKGPMPLSEILKRKRKAEGAASNKILSSIDENDNNQKESNESLVGSSCNTAVVGAKQGAVSTVFKAVNCKEEIKSSKADAFGATEVKNEANHDGRSQFNNGSELEPEEAMIGSDEAMEDHELEAEDQRDGKYEYEQRNEGDYNYEEGENAEVGDEYLYDEDADDFAKKIGIMFS